MMFGGSSRQMLVALAPGSKDISKSHGSFPMFFFFFFKLLHVWTNITNEQKTTTPLKPTKNGHRNMTLSRICRGYPLEKARPIASSQPLPAQALWPPELPKLSRGNLARVNQPAIGLTWIDHFELMIWVRLLTDHKKNQIYKCLVS